LVRGREISGYYSIKDDINNAGGVYVDAPFVKAGRIVTSPHYKHMGPWMAEVLRVYESFQA
jgi:protease I